MIGWKIMETEKGKSMNRFADFIFIGA